MLCSVGPGVIGADSCSGDIALTVAASYLKFLPAYVMFCTLLGILDFPHQECQLNRKRDKLRELSIPSKQVTMNNKEREKKSDSSQTTVLWMIHHFYGGMSLSLACSFYL